MEEFGGFTDFNLEVGSELGDALSEGRKARIAWEVDVAEREGSDGGDPFVSGISSRLMSLLA